MPHIFTPDTSVTPTAWKMIRPLRGEIFTLPRDVLIRRPGGDAARLGGASWYLLSPAGANVRVNGESVFLGSRAVHHRDEILIEGERFFFSTEKLAAIEPLPDMGHTVHCARCKQAAPAGGPAVCCPGCGAWFHQNGEYGCWTYDEKCSLCGFSTALGGGYQWTPDLEGWS